MPFSKEVQVLTPLRKTQGGQISLALSHHSMLNPPDKYGSIFLSMGPGAASIEYK